MNCLKFNSTKMASWNWGIMKDSWQKKNSFDGHLLPGLQLMPESQSSLHPVTAALLGISELGTSAPPNLWNSGPKLFPLNSGARDPVLLLVLSFAFYLVKYTSYVRMTCVGDTDTCRFFCDKAKWVAQVILTRVFFTEILFQFGHLRDTETFLLLTCKQHTPWRNRVSTGPWQGGFTAWRFELFHCSWQGPRGWTLYSNARTLTL